MMSILRNSTKAIIFRDESLLVIRHSDAEGDWYTLPGGGQKPGETLADALRRECLEELGVEVDVGPLRFVREYIGAHHEFRDTDSGHHQIEFVFECRLKADPSAIRPLKPDAHQSGTAWLALDTLPVSRLYPKILRRLLSDGVPSSAPVYLGDVN